MSVFICAMFLLPALIKTLSAININRVNNKGCTVLEIKCPEPEGPCIPLYSMCDGQPDCQNGWDEVDANCPECFGFQCGNGTCIPTAWVCDYDEDCDSGEDEKVDCPPCRRCSGLDMCLPMDWVCDGIADCDDKSDEEVCTNREISTSDKDDGKGDGGTIIFEPCNGIRCPTGFCATYDMFTCNGVNDCGDWSDERGCPCEKGMIDCGRCIPAEWWCDSFPDCPYDDDEKNCTDSTNDIPPEFTRNGGRPGFIIPAGGIISPSNNHRTQLSTSQEDRLSPELQKIMARKQLIKSRAVGLKKKQRKATT